MQERLVVFAHGKESGPWGSKIKHLAAIARAHHYAVESPDYSHSKNPQQRVELLLELAPQAERLLLVGSSMGGYVSAMACRALQPDGLLLLAPALYFDGFAAEPEQCPIDTVVVHGWADDVVPVERSIRFAQSRQAQLHVLADGHRLAGSLEFIGQVFADQLARASARTHSATRLGPR